MTFDLSKGRRILAYLSDFRGDASSCHAPVLGQHMGGVKALSRRREPMRWRQW